ARELGQLLAAAQAGEPGLDLPTLAGNLGTRRTHFATRTAFAATGLADLAAQLEEFAGDGDAAEPGGGPADGQAAPPAPRPAAGPAALPAVTISQGRGQPRVMMVFAGQGTQWAGCGRELYDTEPAFRDAVDAVDAAWRELAGFSLREECFG